MQNRNGEHNPPFRDEFPLAVDYSGKFLAMPE